MKLNARELRDLDEDTPIDTTDKGPRNPIYFILDDIYDTYNIGGLFRLADALHIEKIYICGLSETPPNHKIKKASIGTYKIVPWEYKESAVEAIEELRKFHSLSLQTQQTQRGEAIPIEIATSSTTPRNDHRGVQVVAVEQSEKSVPYTSYNFQYPLVLVVGNETTGVAQETLDACDAIVEIPMHGVNKSLNVIVSAAIVGYHVSASLFDKLAR